MKRPILMVLGTWLALGAGAWADQASETAVKVAALYQQGLRAMKEGNAAQAQQCFAAVLRMQPTHGNARYHLLTLRQRGPQLAATVRQRKLSQVEIPKVDFVDTSVADAIEALGILVEKETKGSFVPNFVVQDPAGVFDSRSVTMKLNAVPAKVVLDYILRIGLGTARYDEFAIVIKPLGGGAAGKPDEGADERNGRKGDPFAP